MGIAPTSEAWEAIERDVALISYIARNEDPQRFIALRFASSTHLCYYEARMSARILTGGLQAVLPGKLAVRGNRGEQCAVCETCKALVCNVLG